MALWARGYLGQLNRQYISGRACVWRLNRDGYCKKDGVDCDLNFHHCCLSSTLERTVGVIFAAWPVSIVH